MSPNVGAKNQSAQSFSPENARWFFEEGGFLFIPNLPEGFEFGIDYNSWTTGPKFKGVKMIPPGCHYIFISCRGKFGDKAPRIGFFYYFKPREMVVRYWDDSNEDLIEENDPEQVERIRGDVKSLDPMLGAYPYENYKKWYSLSYLIDEYLINRLQPKNKRISAQVDLVSKEFEELGTSGQRVDREHPIRVRYRDAEGLPILKLKPGSEIRFTHIPKANLTHCTAKERTAVSMDRSYALREMFTTYQEDKQLLGELQFAYVCFLIGHVFEGFEQWKLLVELLCNCEEAIGERQMVFRQFVMLLYYQLKVTPEEFFVDIVVKNNFLTANLSNFFSILQSNDRVDASFKLIGANFKKSLTVKYRWNFDVISEDYDPVVVPQ